MLPACSRAAGMANAGPIPITSGGTPTTALALRTPRTGRPRASTADLRPISTAAAPSLTWLALPDMEQVCELERGLIPITCGSRCRLTCCGAAVWFEDRFELRESRQSRSGSDPFVLTHGHLPLVTCVVYESGGDGNDLLLEQTGALSPSCSKGGTRKTPITPVDPDPQSLYRLNMWEIKH